MMCGSQNSFCDNGSFDLGLIVAAETGVVDEVGVNIVPSSIEDVE